MQTSIQSRIQIGSDDLNRYHIQEGYGYYGCYDLSSITAESIKVILENGADIRGNVIVNPNTKRISFITPDGGIDTGVNVIFDPKAEVAVTTYGTTKSAMTHNAGSSYHTKTGGDAWNRDISGNAGNFKTGRNAENSFVGGNATNYETGGNAKNYGTKGDAINCDTVGNAINEKTDGYAINFETGGKATNIETGCNAENSWEGGTIWNIYKNIKNIIKK